MQARGPEAAVLDPRVGREAEQLLRSGRDVAQRGARRPLGDVRDRADLLDQRAVAALGLDDLVDRAQAGGDVDQHGEERGDRARLRAHGGERDLHVERRAVAPGRRQQRAMRAAAGQRVLQLALALEQRAGPVEHLGGAVPRQLLEGRVGVAHREVLARGVEERRGNAERLQHPQLLRNAGGHDRLHGCASRLHVRVRAHEPPAPSGSVPLETASTARPPVRDPHRSREGACVQRSPIGT